MEVTRIRTTGSGATGPRLTQFQVTFGSEVFNLREYHTRAESALMRGRLAVKYKHSTKAYKVLMQGCHHSFVHAWLSPALTDPTFRKLPVEEQRKLQRVLQRAERM